MTKTTWTAIALAVTLLSPPALAQDIDLEGVAMGDAPDVQQLAGEWMQAYNQADAETLGALYTEDARLYIHGQPSLRGRDAIVDYWAADMSEANPLTVMTVTDPVQGYDMVLVHGNYSVIERDTGLPLGQGRFAHIWVLDTDGEWRLDRDLWNQPSTVGDNPYRF